MKKRLLVLGGTNASLDVVRIAKSMGAYVIVTDDGEYQTRVAKKEADEHRSVSTSNMSGLLELIKKDKIDGVFCGPSEFNIRNMIRLCELAKLPCYTDEAHFDICSDKLSLKRYCERNGVYVPKRITELDKISENEFPLIVKPTGGCSSKGVSVCRNIDEVENAFEYARTFGGNAYAEEYIDNGGKLFSARYFIKDGKAYPYLTLNTYIADPNEKKRLISALSVYPAAEEEEYFSGGTDAAFRRVIADMGLKNGTAFFQSIPKDGHFYAIDMGYRLSGGMMYKLTEPLVGLSDMKMMIRYALGGEICTESELERLLNPKPLAFAQLTTPLNVGRICEIQGMEEIRRLPELTDILQYYYEGDRLEPSVIGTLGQHFARFTLQAENKERVLCAVKKLQDLLHIKDEYGNEMYTLRFDLNRVK